MSRPSTAISLNDEDRQTLNAWVRSGTSEQRLVLRAKIILAIAAGENNLQVARRMNVRPGTVCTWRKRFASAGLAGLQDAPRAGRAPSYDASTEKRVLEKLDDKPPKGQRTWTGDTLAEALGVSHDYVWRVLRKHKIHLQRRRSWCVSTDPQFAAKAADIVGLYLGPPENAVVISVDEKPSIQALERAQGYLRLPDGQTFTGFSHDYKRHGTTTLFAALNVITGQVKAGHYHRRRRREFLDFMNEVVAAYPGQELHIILDNLNTHKPKNDRWLARHKNVHFHFTPTHASWLNQIECWFSILSRQALRGASFTSPRQVREAIDEFIAAYNETAAPFAWTKAEVGQKQPKNKYADLRN